MGRFAGWGDLCGEVWVGRLISGSVQGRGGMALVSGDRKGSGRRVDRERGEEG